MPENEQQQQLPLPTEEQVTPEKYQDALWEAAAAEIDQELGEEHARATGEAFEYEDEDEAPAPQAAQTPAPTAPATDAPDPWEGLTDAQKTFFQQQQEEMRNAKAQYLSAQGRVAQWQREKAEQEAKLKELEDFQKTTKEEQLKAPMSLDDIPAAKEWVERYEGGEEDAALFARVVQQAVDTRLKQIGAVNPQGGINQEQVQQLVQQETAKLEQQIVTQRINDAKQMLDDTNSPYHRPGWSEVAKSVEYRQWKSQLPQEDQQFINNAIEAHHVAGILDTFARDTGRAFQGWPTGENGDSQTQSQPSYQDLQLAAATQAPVAQSTRSSLPETSQVMSGDELWNQLAEQSNAELLREAR